MNSNRVEHQALVLPSPRPLPPRAPPSTSPISPKTHPRRSQTPRTSTSSVKSTSEAVKLAKSSSLPSPAVSTDSSIAQASVSPKASWHQMTCSSASCPSTSTGHGIWDPRQCCVWKARRQRWCPVFCPSQSVLFLLDPSSTWPVALDSEESRDWLRIALPSTL